ncbi:MAG TPA: GNAT family N-acetyltransferase [Kofleriaceae bacterium]
MSELESPIWSALQTEQARFAERDGDAARFPPAVTALAGLRETTAAALASLGRLMRRGETVGVFLDQPLAMPPGIALVDTADVLQMLHDGATPAIATGIELLGDADMHAMIALADATRPGPFSTRTAELGTFLGIRVGGRLAAMAGQRMRLPGLVEISAVCTDPAHAGHGYAASLVQAQLALIHRGGHGAFLHVRADNARAIGLYERLGFRGSRTFRYSVLRAA